MPRTNKPQLENILFGLCLLFFFLIVYDGFASGKPISKWHVEREDVQILTVAPGDGSFQAIEEILEHLVNLHSKPAAQAVGKFNSCGSCYTTSTPDGKSFLISGEI